MAVLFVVDGKPTTKHRLPYIPREGELVEFKDRRSVNLYTIELVQHRIDTMSPIGVTETIIHLKSVKKRGKGKKKEAE